MYWFTVNGTFQNPSLNDGSNLKPSGIRNIGTNAVFNLVTSAIFTRIYASTLSPLRTKRILVSAPKALLYAASTSSSPVFL